MSSWERAMAVGTSGLMGTVDSSRSIVEIEACAAVITELVPSALRWITEALAARVMSSNNGLLVN